MLLSLAQLRRGEGVSNPLALAIQAILQIAPAAVPPLQKHLAVIMSRPNTTTRRGPSVLVSYQFVT